MRNWEGICRGIVVATLASLIGVESASAMPPMDQHFYLPNASASKIVSVAKGGTPEAEVIILTERIAVKETGPKETVAKFGEVYAFSPTFIAIRREVPTMLTFWNLQSDDEHDFMLAAPDSTVLMHPKLAAEVKPFIAQRGWTIPADDAWLERAVATLHERAKTLVELRDFLSFYVKDSIELDPKAAAKFLKPEIAEPLRALAAELEAHEGEVSEASVQAVFESVLAKFSLKLGQLAQPVRVALTGGTVSPGIYEVIAVLGKRRTVDRLNAAVRRIEQPA